MRENFTANLASYAHTVATEKPEEYKGQVQSAMTAGEPIRQHDKEQLDKALKARLEQALREAECKAKMEAEAKAKRKRKHTQKRNWLQRNLSGTKPPQSKPKAEGGEYG